MRLLLAGVLSEAVYLWMARLPSANGLATVASFLCAMALLFALCAYAYRQLYHAVTRPALVAIFAAALVFRLTLILAGLPDSKAGLFASLRADVTGTTVEFDRFLLFDHDVWRFLWEGHVSSHRGSPAAFPPEDADHSLITPYQSERDWDHVLSFVNHPEEATVYPPLAQQLFLVSHAIAPGSVVAWKACVIAVDMAAMLFTALGLHAAGRSPGIAVLYGWNPLVVKVGAGSGHFDALVACTVALCVWALLRRWRLVAALAFVSAALAKVFPVILFPLVLRRTGWRPLLVAGSAGLVVVATQPGLIERLLHFGTRWRFNGGVHRALYSVESAWGGAGGVSTAICAALALLIIAVVALRDDGAPHSFAGRAADTLGGCLVVSPAVFPWYVTWLLPAAVIGRRWHWVAFSALVCAAFLVMVNGREYPAALLLEYGALLALWLRFRDRKTERGFL